MNLVNILILLVALVCLQLNGQTFRGLKPNDRPVFMSAERLALLCGDWNSLNPNGEPPKAGGVLNVSPQQIVRAGMCESYILGVMDSDVDDATKPRYHPVPATLDFLKPLVDTFLKYVKDHPEEEDMSARTILEKAVHLIEAQQTPAKQ